MSIKFTALIPFMHGENVYSPTGVIYEHNDETLVRAWEHHEYAKIVEERKDTAFVKKEVETVKNDADTSQIDVSDDLEQLSYKELQAKAKAAGIKSTGVKAKDLIKQLKEVE